VTGALSDRLGRKPITVLALLLQSALGVGMAFNTNFWLLIAMMFFQAFASQGMMSGAVTLTMELLHGGWRPLAVGIRSSFGALSLSLLAVVWWWLNDWRHTLLAASVYSFSMAVLVCFLPESIRWLVSQGDTKRAISNMRWYARIGGVKLSDDVDSDLTLAAKEFKGQQEKVVKHGFLDLFRSPVLRKYTIKLLIARFGCTLLAFGINYYIPNLFGSIYVNYGVSGGMDAMGAVAGFIIFSRTGRRKPMVSAFLCSGTLCFASVVTSVLSNAFPGYEYAWIISTVLVLLSKSVLTIFYVGFLLVVNELYPTQIRSAAFGFQLSLGMVITIPIPYIILLRSVWQELPLVIFGSAAILGGLVFLTLPESATFPIVDTIEEAERIGRDRKRRGESITSDVFSITRTMDLDALSTMSM